ncbi:MAG: hypothetical protein ACRCZS_12635 [Chroococcidiopsis sp.]
MAKHGIVEFARGANRIGVKPPATITANYDITLPPALPPSTQAIQRDATGVESYFTPVTALNLSTEANAVLASSVAAGAISLDLDTQTANLIFASPTTGGAAKPTFRNLVLADFGGSPPAFNEWGAPQTAVNMNIQRVTNVVDPLAPQDAATKNYVDSTVQGFTVKLPAQVATTANITLSGLQTIDGIALTANARVLVKNQTTASQNGIYIVQAGAWTRATDADAGSEISSAMYLFVQQGTTNADTGWVLTTDGIITIGTTALNFTQFSGAGAIASGNGLTKTGNQLDVVGTAGRIVANADNIDLATTGVTAGTYNSVTVDAYGRVTTATAVATAEVYRTSFTNAALTGGILTVTHNLGKQFGQPTIWDNNNKKIDPDDFTATSTTVMTVDLSSYGAITGAWNIVVVS